MAPVLIDPVTGLFDRRRFVALAEQEARRAVRYGRPMTVLAVAVRNLTGSGEPADREAAIRHAAGLLSDAIREHDVLGHLGGGLFAIALTETGEAGAAVVARRLEERISGAAAAEDGRPVRLEARTAVAACRPEEEPSERTLERAVAMLSGGAAPEPVDHHVEDD
jgi:diguanylate cyclase (GGDEF)-like protein